MMLLSLALLLASRDSTVDIAPQTCFREHFRAGTGIPMKDRAAIKADRNLIVSVDLLIHGPGNPQKGTAAALGYVLHIADGEQYYEPAGGLSDSEKLVELQFLKRAHAFAALSTSQVKAFVNLGSGIAKLSDSPARGLEKGLRLRQCTVIRNRR